jgi:hypothetical protein
MPGWLMRNPSRAVLTFSEASDTTRAALDSDQLYLPDQPGQPCGGGAVGQDDGAVLGADGDMGHGFTFAAPIADCDPLVRRDLPAPGNRRWWFFPRGARWPAH